MTDHAGLRRIIDAYHTLTLGTVSADGPWTASVFFACDADLTLYFVSDHRTRHARDMAGSSGVAAAINADVSLWKDVKGIQLRGTTLVLEGPARAHAREVFLAKFPDVSRMFAGPTDKHERTIAERLSGANFYGLKPAMIRVIDNARGFGHREEYTFD